jgi:hypothetical protein
MKQLISVLASALVLLAALSPVATIVVPAVAITACKTSKATIAYRSLASLQTAVSTSLGVWADHVVSQRALIAKIEDRSEQSTALRSLASKESKARAALDGYKAAMATAKIAVDAALANNTDPAPAPVLDAGTKFIATISTLTK